MTQHFPDFIAIIPSYEPKEEFVDYAKQLSAHVTLLLVVNDGSGAEYDAIFDEIARLPNAVCLRHVQNKGKGCALKTAFAYCAAHASPDAIAVTADCDGQHLVEDVVNIYSVSRTHPDALVLGSRDFTLSNIPPKSQFGNTLFRKSFRFFYRLNVYDTQTGLRGFPVSLADEFTHVRGERFEYEMGVLIYAKKTDVPILEEPIKTIYPECPQDHVTHYKPVKDTLQILGVVLKNLWIPKRRAIRKSRRGGNKV